MELDHLKDINAEKSLLGALLATTTLIKKVYLKIKPENFYSNKHQIIYKAIENLFKNGENIDIVTVSDELFKDNHLDKIGGRAYINDLALSHITSAPYLSWISIIKEKYVIREIQKIGQNLIDGCYNSQKSNEILNNLQVSIYNLSQEQEDKKEGTDLKDILIERYDQIGNAYDNFQSTEKIVIQNTISTGYKQFDKYLRGGFKAGELTLIAARSRIGKTAFSIALQRAISNHNNDYAIADFQLETCKDELADRHFSNITGIKKGYFTYVNNLNNYSFSALTNSLEQINKATPFRVFTYADFNVLEIETKSAQFFNEVGKKGIVFIDNLQIIDDVRKGRNDIETSSNITRDCKKLAQRLNIPVILLCQLTKEAEDNQEPNLKDIRGSMQVIANADNIFLLHRDTTIDTPETEMKIIFEKVRKGQTGRLTMYADLSTNKFIERVS
jgi:replicative DNA helicase